MILMHRTLGVPVEPGDVVRRGEDVFVVSNPVGAPPHKPSSSGKVYIECGDDSRTLYPSVLDMQWTDE